MALFTSHRPYTSTQVCVLFSDSIKKKSCVVNFPLFPSPEIWIPKPSTAQGTAFYHQVDNNPTRIHPCHLQNEIP